MRGNLSETPVADLCRGLSAAGATGAVEVVEHGGDARIFFRGGVVHWAVSPTPRARLGDRLVNGGMLSAEQLDDALEAQRSSDDGTKLGALLVERGLVSRDVIRVFVQEQILDAMFEMMQWHEGAYVFNPGEVVDEKLPIDIPVDQLLVEVSRRQSEWAQIQEVIPYLDMVPDFVTGDSTANAALEPDEFTVLANVDGGRSIRDLAEDLGYSEFEAARIVYGLTLLRIVAVRPPDGAAEASDDLAWSEDLEGADDDSDVDVGSALEEALIGQGGVAASTPDDDIERPAVKLHVDDEVRGYLSAHDGPTDLSSPPRTPSRPPDAEARTADAGERSVEQLTEALTAALDDEPEPWVASDPAPGTSAPPDLGFFAGSPAGSTDGPDDPGTADDLAARDLPDEDFDALMDELTGPVEDAPDAEAPPAEETAPETAAEQPPADQPAPATRSGGGDVSEFLRELSRLAVDEPPTTEDGGSSGQRPKPAATEAESTGEAPAASRDEDRRRAAEKREDAKKKKGGGLFGWGR